MTNSLFFGIFFLLGMMGTGWISFYFLRERIKTKLAFTKEFFERLKQYIASQGSNIESYSWMIHNSEKMQKTMGQYGRYELFQPACSVGYFQNYPAIINLLPELRSAFDDNIVLSRLSKQYGSQLQEIILRYLGVLESQQDECISGSHNPIICFKVGCTQVLLFPLQILAWLGILAIGNLNSVQSNLTFKLISNGCILISFLASIVGIVTGWSEFIRILEIQLVK
mgnify:CR=1 FL=1